MKKFFAFSFSFILLFSVLTGEARAFWKKTKKRETLKAQAVPAVPVATLGTVRVIEKKDHMILFSIYPLQRKGESGSVRVNDPEWSEVGYKLVDKTESPGKLFGDTGWIELRFQDKDGFNLVSAPVHFENPKTEYYGFARVENAKAGQIAQVELKTLKSSEIPKNTEEVKPEPSVSPVPGGASALPEKETQVIVPVVQKDQTLQPELPAASPAPEPSSVAPSVSAAPGEGAGHSAGNEVVTNAVIQKTLEELEKKASPETQTPEGAVSAGPAAQTPGQSVA